MNPIHVILLFIFLLAAPQPDADELDPKVEEAVQEAIRLRREAFMTQCRIEAVEQASHFVDSLLLAQAPTTSEDSLIPPPRPERPELDPVLLEEDTMPLRPILPPTRKEQK
ncbi:MAG: hypothetical protein R2787_15710 [Saprospiraceae bacterium]|nr:hypothetical protein [Saprospiraceae bacterium]MCB9313201.1 hypothetical protein [Lewinellaceae bacterium]HRW76131.1 hypothetical protein [Saprospiraceae bacterium]